MATHEDAVQMLQDLNEDMVKEFLLESSRRIVERTPVDSGVARGSWRVSDGQSNESVTNKAGDQSGSSTVARMKGEINSVQFGGIVSIENDVPYIGFIEFGTDTIPPHQMVTRTAHEAPEITKDAFRKVTK